MLEQQSSLVSMPVQACSFAGELRLLATATLPRTSSCKQPPPVQLFLLLAYAQKHFWNAFRV